MHKRRLTGGFGDETAEGEVLWKIASSPEPFPRKLLCEVGRGNLSNHSNCIGQQFIYHKLCASCLKD